MNPHHLRFSSPDVVAAPFGAYSHLVVVTSGSDLIFVSGQTGLKPDGTCPASAAEQYAQALRNIVALLKNEASGPEYLVKLDSFLVAPIPGDEVKRSRAEILGAIRPAATLIYVPRLAEERFLVEIQAVAIRPPLANKDTASGDAR
jgi:2-iminobutanoate/2-iminopropanoate deaminase